MEGIEVNREDNIDGKVMESSEVGLKADGKTNMPNTSSSSTADLSVKDISTSELDKDVKDGDTSGLDTNVKDADTSKASTGAKEGKTAIGKRCFRQLKDLAELNFTAYKNSDNVIEFRKKKTPVQFVNLKSMLIKFKQNIFHVVSRYYYTTERKGQPAKAQFTSGDMMINCIRETWLHPDIVKGEQDTVKLHFKEFKEVVGTVAGTELFWCKAMFKNNLFHLAMPVSKPFGDKAEKDTE